MRANGILKNSAHRVRHLNTEAFDLNSADWDDLRLFQVILTATSIRAAAKLEGLAVNTIRNRLSRLEQALDRALLRRTTRGVVLTEAGERLLDTIGKMSDAALHQRISGSSDVLVHPGELTIACSEGLGTLWLTPRMAQLRREISGLTVGLMFDYNLARDRAGEADIWLAFERPARQDLIVSKLATLHFLPFASHAYLDHHGAPETVDDLKSHRIIEHCGAGVRSELLDYLIGSDRPDGLVTLRTNSSLAQLWAVAEGEGIGGLPTFVRELTRSIVPVPPTLQIRRELWLVYHADARHSPSVRAAIDWLRLIFDESAHPCFRDTFVHPDHFPAQKHAGGVVQLFHSVFDRMDGGASDA